MVDMYFIELRYHQIMNQLAPMFVVHPPAEPHSAQQLSDAYISSVCEH
jgi:hypothetical protein